MKMLIKKLQFELKIIRRAYKKTVSLESTDILFEWLSDNYYILERECKSVIKTLKHSGKLPEKKGLPELYNMSRKICLEGILPPTSELENAVADASLSVAESELLPVMLRCALIYYAALECAKISAGKRDAGSPSTCINAIKSLRRIQDIDFETINEKTGEVEKILTLDPSGEYPLMDDATRSAYRHAVAAKAKRERIPEKTAAENALKRAEEKKAHIGFELGVYSEKIKAGARRVLLLEIVMPLFISLSAAILLRRWYFFVILIFPFFEIVKVFTDSLARERSRPRLLPRLELSGKVPPEAQTMIAVSMLLPSAAKAESSEKHLSQLFRSNANGAVNICVLADLKNNENRVSPSDEADIEAMKRVIGKLNTKYNGGFLLAVRPRSFSKTQNEYSGTERKRGAVTALCNALRGHTEGFMCLFGDTKNLTKTKYIMALDSDTSMPLGTLSQLVSAAVHPLNRPVLNTENRTVKSGYGIFCPSIATSIKSASKNTFTGSMSGTGGITAYNNVVSDKYQDLFHFGIFTGKGLIDVDTFLYCTTDRFPSERVLSHDILEGELCRCANVADVQLTDSFPSSENSYMSRLHRWVRGDWQNIIYLFKSYKVGSKRQKNPYSLISKYKLFDNLRRSATPAVLVLTLFLTFFMPRETVSYLIGIIILSVTAGELLSSIKALFSGGFSMLSRLFYSGALPGALDAIIKAALSLIMLAQTGFVCLDAIIRALYRSFISSQNLLEWTTAAESDAGSELGSVLKKYWKSGLLGLLLLIFSTPVGRLCGIAFLYNIIFALTSSKEKKRSGQKISQKTQEKLTGYAASMWKFYDEHCRSLDNYLPPDNIQETPVHAIAHRTSPTNIGLMLCCVLAARDLGFIDSKTMYQRIKNSLDSIEKLEKWNGNLLNWYNTKNLKPLEPKYCSAIDSGNFICCLVALNQGLGEYVADYPQLQELKTRIAAIIKDCSFAPFYNRQRALFHIGYDLSEEKLSLSYYDLFMSESRMLSYYAVSSLEIPQKHWGTLSRTLAKDGRYTGPISWTGTMFEYFMPSLFIPVISNTLVSEGLRFCLRCQKERVKGKGIPYGISESGFYAFDSQLNYQYKAHGVQKLGLKRALNSDLVISPYSTFLTLPIDLSGALKNLQRLDNLELCGRFGFYEAADFTHSRIENQSYAVVRSYMAHHIGMSMLSVVNTLLGNSMQKRFMSDERMAAGISLLEEKIPCEAVVFKDIEKREVPNRPERFTAQKEEVRDISPLYPRAKLLSNGEWTSVVSDTGVSVSLYRGADIITRSGDMLRNPCGVFAAVETKSGLIPFTKAPFYKDSAAFEAEFSGRSISFNSKRDNLECSIKITLHPHIPLEQRQFTVKNNGKQNVKCKLKIYFEPCLCESNAFNSHPSFSRLFLKSSYNKDDKIIEFTRTIRNSSEALSLAVGFCEMNSFRFETDREAVLPRENGVLSLFSSSWHLSNSVGKIDNCCAFEVPLEIPAKGEKSLSLLLSAASTVEEASNQLLRVRKRNGIIENKAAACPFKTDTLDGIAAAKILPLIYFGAPTSRNIRLACEKNEQDINALWKLSISGDEPLICVTSDTADDINNAVPLIRLGKTLSRCGIQVTLALLYREQESYVSDYLDKLREILKREKYEQSLYAKGGVVPINITATDPCSVNAVIAAAIYTYPEQDRSPANAIKQYEPQALQSIAIHENAKPNDFTQNGYRISQKQRLPWCHTLTNGSFGTLVTDSSPGYTWALNSRENKLTPWSNDTSRDLCGELLYAKIKGQIYDLLKIADCEFTDKEAIYNGEINKIAYTVTISVPPKGMKKEISINFNNQNREECLIETAYYIEPLLSENIRSSRFIKTSAENESTMLFRNPYNSAYYGIMALSSESESETISGFCTNRAAFFSGKWEKREAFPVENPSAAAIKKIKLPPYREESLRFILSYAKSSKAAMIIATRKTGTANENRIIIDTPDEELNNLFNNFLAHQIKSTRIEGRTAFYQCGGAYGFRDQLQDVSALVLTHPEITKRQIYRSCAVQFKEGDVLHWWHVAAHSHNRLKGVRTRYSDDLLWLPFVCAEYVLKTGDMDILDKQISYLSAMELFDDEHDRFFTPDSSLEKGSVYEHCERAIERASRFGKNGLPLIGGGDWNDSFNKVGELGRGESVWLAQFMAMTLKNFAKIAFLKEKIEKSREYNELAVTLLKNVDENAWNGKWYLRAFYDDGSPMGYENAGECEIDLLPQAFAVLSGMPDEERRRTALNSVLEKLVDEENGLIKLFSPPFRLEGKPTGYVNTYPEGIRENGGQYTHAAVWFIRALFEEGMSDEAYRLLRMINPAAKYKDEVIAKKYKTEPFALAADVYTAKGMEGRGGWSLYTGAAGWYYRTVYESMLGIKQEAGQIKIRPSLPEGFEGSEVTLCLDSSEKKIEINEKIKV